MKKRLLCMLLVLAMALTVFPISAMAADPVDTVIYQGSDWPYSRYYIASLTLSGPAVSYIEGTTVYLDSGTAKDAAITLTAAAGGSSAEKLGVNWNDEGTNTKTYTTNLVDGTASVKVYAYKASGAGVSRSGTKTFTFQIAEPNQAPALASGVAAETTASVTSGTAYELDLTTIFADADNDTLTYTVSVNGAAAAAADANYSYLNTVPGTYVLKFAATDGKTMADKQPTHTVNLTVTNSETTYDVNVTVPEGVAPAFYAVNTVSGGTAVKGDALTYADGIVKVPENISRIMWEAENVTGCSVPVSAGASVELVKVNFNAKYDADPADAVTVEIKDSEGVKVTGTAADTYLLPAVSGFTYRATATGTNSGNYNAVELTEQTPASGSVEISFLRKHFTVIAPKGSVVSAGTLSGSFAYSFATAISSVEDGDTVVYEFAPLKGNAFVRVQHPDNDAVTYWDWKSSKADGQTVTVTEEMLFMGDESSEDAFNSDTVYRNFEKFAMDLGDIYMNINNQGYINLNVGDSRGLNMFRNWMAIESFSNAKISLPDFAYEVINLEGENVIEITPNANNTAAATLTAKNEGTAIVLVTYDAMYSDSTVGNSGGSAGGGNRYTAIWPDRTGVFVVSVGKDGTAIKSNMTCNGAIFDAEHSPQFYVGDAGASVSFTPDEGVTVTVNRSTVGEETLSFGAFTGEGVSVNAETGEVTVSGLKTGRHIIKFEKDGVASYQVVTAQQVNAAFYDAEGNSLGLNPRVEPGTSLTLKINGLTNPAEKFPTKYNFNAQVTYKDENGNAYKNSSGAGYGRYDFSSQEQVINITVPSDWAGDTMTLNGYIQMGGFSGGSVGDHRKVSYGTASGMATGSTAGMVLGTLPELVIQVGTATHEHSFVNENTDEIYLVSAADCENAAVYYKSCECGAAGTEPFSYGEALGHDMQETAAKVEATCEADGKEAVLTCANGCGKTEGGAVIPASGHDMQETAAKVEATCEADGKEAVLTCANGCGKTEGGAVIPAAKCSTDVFTDVNKTDWYHSAIDYVHENSLMSGIGGDKFGPDGTMTRSMAVTVLYRLAGSPAVEGTCKFTDCEAGSWYTNAVIWATENGVTAGTSDTTFAPDAEVTREQMATFLYRYAKVAGYDVSVSDDATLDAYPDASKVGFFATDALLWAVDNGIISGGTANGKIILNPQGDATRAQVAMILMRYCENIVQ